MGSGFERMEGCVCGGIEFRYRVHLDLPDFKFVPLMFVTLGLGTQIPILRTILHGLGTQTQGYKP